MRACTGGPGPWNLIRVPSARSAAVMPSDSPADLAPAHVRALQAYVPGLQPTGGGWVKLNTNENPYPPSPRVAEAITAALADGALRLYPDPPSTELRRAFAQLYGHGLQPENVLVGNGSDDVLNLLVRAFCGGSNRVGFMLPSYSLYPVLVAIAHGESRPIEFARDMRLPVAAVAESNARLVFLTSPNAPTGVGFRAAEIDKLARAFSGLLVVDEAYADFAEENALGLLAKHPRLVITRTLSKSHGLAGLRVGCAVAHPEVISLLDRVRDSYNVNRLSQAGGLAAIRDPAYTAAIVARIRATRARTEAGFAQLGWFTYPSQANFLFTEPRTRAGGTGPEVARSCYDHLVSRRVLVRYFGSHALTNSFLRITVGTDPQMETLAEGIHAWLQTA